MAAPRFVRRVLPSFLVLVTVVLQIVAPAFAATPQTVTWSAAAPAGPLDWKTVVGLNINYATASSGLTISYSSLTTSVCTVSSGTVTGRSAGTCTVRAYQFGGSGWASAYADHSITLSATTQTPTFRWTKSSATYPYRALYHPVTVTTNATGAPVGTSLTPTVCEARTSQAGTYPHYVLPLATGLCQVEWYHPGDANYLASTPTTMSLTIAEQPAPTLGLIRGPMLPADRAEGTIFSGQSAYVPVTPNPNPETAGVPPYQDPDHAPAGAPADWGRPKIRLTTNDQATCSATPTTWFETATGVWYQYYDLTNTAAGSCVLDATVEDSTLWPNGSAVTKASYDYTVLRTQTITTDSFDPRTPAGTVLKLSPTATSRLAVSVLVTPSTVCSFATPGTGNSALIAYGASANLTMWTTTGTCTVTYKQAGDGTDSASSSYRNTGTWAPAQTVTRTTDADVGRYPISLRATDLLSKAAATSFRLDSGLELVAAGPSDDEASTMTVLSGPCTISAKDATRVSWVLRSTVAGASCNVQATVVKAGYTDGLATLTVTTTRGQQTIENLALDPVKTTYLIGEDATPTATATSGLDVSFRVSAASAGVCALTAGKIEFTGYGECTVIASQLGDSNWFAAEDVSSTFTVRQAQTLRFDLDGDLTPLDATKSVDPSTASGTSHTVVAASATSGLPVSISVLSGPCLVGSLSTVYVVVSESLDDDVDCVLRAHQDGAGRYEPVEATATLRLRLPKQTITRLPAKPTVGDVFAAPATTGTANPVLIDSLTASVCETLAGSNNAGPALVATALHAGLCSLRATAAGGFGYRAADPVEFDVRIYSASQAIGFTLTGPVRLDTTALPLNGVATSGLAVTYATNDPAVCSIARDGVTLELNGAGACTVTASQAGDSDYAPADDVVQTIVLDRADQVISVTAPSEVGVLAGQLPVLVSSTSNTPVTVTALGGITACQAIANPDPTGPPLVDIIGFGTCSLLIAQAETARFNAAWTVVTFEVVRQAQYVDFAPTPTNLPADTAPWEVHATARYTHWVFGVQTTSPSGFAVTLQEASPLVCSLSGTTATALRYDPKQSADAVCALRGTTGESELFEPADDTHQVTMTRRDQVLEFFPATTSYLMGVDPDRWTQQAYDPTAGLSAALSTTTASVCTTSGDEVRATRFTPIDAVDPVCSLTATSAGNWAWRPATAALDVTLARRDQVLEFFPATTSYLMGVDPDRWTQQAYDPNAGLPATVASIATEVCTVTGDEVASTHYNPFNPFDTKKRDDPVCSLTATSAGNWAWRPATAALDVTLARRDQVLEPSPAFVDKYLGIDTASWTQSAEDPRAKLPASFSSLDASVCAVSNATTDATITIAKAGRCILTMRNEGDWRFRQAEEEARFWVLGVQQTSITFDTLPLEVHTSSAPLTFVASSSSSAPVSVTTSSTTCSVTQTSGPDANGATTWQVTFTYTPGPCELTGTTNPASEYNPNLIRWAAGARSETVNVVRWAQRITPTPNVRGSFPAPLPQWTPAATASSGQPVAVTVSGDCTLNAAGEVESPLFVPSLCAIDYSVNGDRDYEPATLTRTLRFYEPGVTKSWQGISPSPAAAQHFVDDAPWSQQFTATSGLPVDVLVLTPAICDWSAATEEVVLTGAEGECVMFLTQPGDEVWQEAAPLAFKFDVVRHTQQIRFWPEYSTVLWQNDPYPFEATNTTRPAVAPVISVLNPTACGYTLGRLSLYGGPGTVCYLRADVAGDSIFAPAWRLLTVTVIGVAAPTTTSTSTTTSTTTTTTVPNPPPPNPGTGSGNTDVTIPGNNKGTPCRSCTTTTTVPTTPSTAAPTTTLPPGTEGPNDDPNGKARPDGGGSTNEGSSIPGSWRLPSCNALLLLILVLLPLFFLLLWFVAEEHEEEPDADDATH